MVLPDHHRQDDPTIIRTISVGGGISHMIEYRGDAIWNL